MRKNYITGAYSLISKAVTMFALSADKLHASPSKKLLAGVQSWRNVLKPKVP